MSESLASSEAIALANEIIDLYFSLFFFMKSSLIGKHRRASPLS